MIVLGYGNDEFNKQQDRIQGLLSQFLMMQSLNNAGNTGLLKPNPEISNPVRNAVNNFFGISQPQQTNQFTDLQSFKQNLNSNNFFTFNRPIKLF